MCIKKIYIYSIYFFARICITRTSFYVAKKKRSVVINESSKGLHFEEKKKKRKKISLDRMCAREYGRSKMSLDKSQHFSLDKRINLFI